MVEWIAMKNLFSIKNGYTPSKKQKEYWNGGTIPWFRMEDIRQNGTILKDSIQHITPLGVKKGGLFPANSIIVATTATIGEHALIIVDSLANQRFTFLVKCKSYDSKLDMKYMYYYMFIVDEWCKKNTNVSGFASVDMDKFKKLLIPIPSLAEQNRIVVILDTFTASIDNLKEQIALRRKQFEYYREQLLDLEGKPGVEMKTLGEICSKITSGKNKSKTKEGLYPVFGSTGIIAYTDDYIFDKPLILVARVGANAGYVNLSYGKCDVTDNTLVISLKENVILKYIFHCLVKENINKYAKGGGQPLITASILKSLLIALPSISEQERIVSILDTFEASISNLEAQLEQRQKQYEYYRNKLLTFE